MAVFHYKAVGPDGKLVDGEVEARDEKSAIASLRATGYLPVSAKARADRFSAIRFARSIGQWRGRVRARDVTALTQELATLLNAGIPIDAGLRMIERRMPDGRLRMALRRIHEDVRSGKALSGALAAHHDMFDRLYVNLIRAGEASGSLAAVTARLADHRERADAFRASVISALTYPVALVCVAAVSLLVMMTFVIPRFIPLFAEAGATLPLLTEMVFFTATILQRYWWIVLGVMIGVSVAARRWLAVPRNRLWLDRRLLSAPIVGEVLLLTETSRFARMLDTLLRNGLPLLGALRLVRDVQRNRVLAAALDDAISSIRSGGRLAAALDRAGLWPDLAVEFITIGEESGRLEDMLQKVADTFEARTEQRLKRLLTLLEPLLILGLGAGIAIVIVSVLVAMLGLNELVV